MGCVDGGLADMVLVVIGTRRDGTRGVNGQAVGSRSTVDQDWLCLLSLL